MRLLSAHLTNYRVHEDVSVDFDPQASLLGGQNEAGKSTLVEAVHRALFLPAKGDTQVHKGMRRENCKDRPEVRVAFEYDGARYDLYKHFGGNTSYTVTLRREGGAKLEDEAAEERLREITGASLPDGKRTTDETARRPWSHLWVWQGAGGDDPNDFIADTTDDLVKLTAEGAGAVLMSDRDTATARRFRERHEANYTGAGKVKTGSALGKATAERDDCSAEVERLRTEVDKLAGAADRYAAARARLAEDAPKRASVEEALQAARREIAAGEVAAADRDRARSQYQQVLAKAEQLRRGHRQLTEWGERIGTLDAKLKADDGAARYATAVAEANAAHAALDEQLAAAREQRQPLLDRQSRIETRLKLLHARRELTNLEEKDALIRATETELAEVDAQLERLPEIKDSGIEWLRERKAVIVQQQAEYNAVKSTLHVLSAGAGLTLNGTPLTAGTEAQLSAESTIAYGELSLKLTVPGVANAEELRTKLDEQIEAMRLQIGRYVIDGTPAETIDQLADAARERRALLQQQQQLRRRLRDQDAEAVRKALREAKQAAASAEAADARLPDPDDWTDPRDAVAVNALAEATTRAYRLQDERIGTLDAETRAAAKTLQKVRDAETAFAKTRRADEDALHEATSLRANLLQDFDGDPAALHTALTDTEAEEGKAQRALQAAEAQLAALELDVLRTRGKRLAAQLEQLDQSMRNAQTAIAEARGELRLGDGEDPGTALREAEERLQRACADCDRRQLDADADALLHQLFREETEAANASVTEPLAEAVRGYLKRLFGPEAEVKLLYENGAFGEFHLVRPGFSDHAEAFATLSGGAREQVAAAVRLATAELLARDYGGTLPVVFDDAFVNSDKHRVDKIVNMLYYATEQGLQVIFSTCDPERYAGVGQARWTVRRGAGAEVA